MRKLLTLEPPMVQSGLFSGVGEAATPLWSDGDNIVFRDLGVRRIDGGTDVAAGHVSPSTVRALLQGYSAGNQRVYIGTETKIQMLQKSGLSFSGSDLYTWPTAGDYNQLETWGNWLVGTNNVNPVVVWKNGGLAAALGGTPFTRAKVMRRKSPFMLAFNTSNGEDRVEWSNGQTSNIEDWSIGGSSSGGNNTIRDLESEIMAAEMLGDRIGVYSTSSMAIGTYVGSPNWWGFKKAIGGIGAISSKSIVEQGVFHYGLMQNGIFVTDGNSARFIDDPMMQRWLIENVNWDQSRYIWGYHDDYLRAVTWHFLNVDLAWRSVSYHYDSKLFTKGNLQLTAGAAKTALLRPVVADVDRRVSLWQQGQTLRGVDITFGLRTKPLDFGDRQLGKILQMIKVDGDWDATTRMKVGTREHPEAATEWIFDKPMVQHNYLDDDREAPYFVMELYGTKPAYMTGFEFYGVPGGLWH